MDLYNINRIIVLPIAEKMDGWINRDKREVDGLSITNKYEHSSWGI